MKIVKIAAQLCVCYRFVVCQLDAEPGIGINTNTQVWSRLSIELYRSRLSIFQRVGVLLSIVDIINCQEYRYRYYVRTGTRVLEYLDTPRFLLCYRYSSTIVEHSSTVRLYPSTSLSIDRHKPVVTRTCQLTEASRPQGYSTGVSGYIAVLRARQLSSHTVVPAS